MNRITRCPVVCIAIVAIVVVCQSARGAGITNSPWRGFDIYYLRHGEVMGNVAARYEKLKPKDRPANWNSYDAFSELGTRQLTNIVETLKNYRFDVIVVSPTWRTMQTVLPYLKAHKRTAEVWPELTEISTASAPAPGEKLTPNLMYGWPLTINSDVKPYFRLRDPAVTNQCKSTKNYTDAHALIAASARLLSERFGNSGTSVLVVGHSVAGAALIRQLAGLGPTEKFWLHNAQVSHLRQLPDGTFKLLELNAEPYVPHIDKPKQKKGLE